MKSFKIEHIFLKDLISDEDKSGVSCHKNHSYIGNPSKGMGYNFFEKFPTFCKTKQLTPSIIHTLGFEWF